MAVKVKTSDSVLFQGVISGQFPTEGERDGGRNRALDVALGVETPTFEHPTPLLTERLEPVAQDVGIIANICEAGGNERPYWIN